MSIILSRRSLILGAAAVTALATAPAYAQGVDQARQLVDSIVADVNAVIASGASEAQMIQQFAGIFDRYADVPTIARYSLGADARAATAPQLEAFTVAFRGYIARKYGKRFREFVGGQIIVNGAREVPNGIEVETTAVLRNSSPFRVDWHVSAASGRMAFFNIIIEGVNMLLSERTEIQALLDQRGRSIDRLTADLANMG